MRGEPQGAEERVALVAQPLGGGPLGGGGRGVVTERALDDRLEIGLGERARRVRRQGIDRQRVGAVRERVAQRGGRGNLVVGEGRLIALSTARGRGRGRGFGGGAPIETDEP